MGKGRPRAAAEEPPTGTLLTHVTFADTATIHGRHRSRCPNSRRSAVSTCCWSLLQTPATRDHSRPLLPPGRTLLLPLSALTTLPQPTAAAAARRRWQLLQIAAPRVLPVPPEALAGWV